MPMPRPGQVLGLVGTNGIGKSTALKILAGKLKPNLGRFENPPDWEEILGYFRGSELQVRRRRSACSNMGSSAGRSRHNSIGCIRQWTMPLLQTADGAPDVHLQEWRASSRSRSSTSSSYAGCRACRLLQAAKACAWQPQPQQLMVPGTALPGDCSN
jgi:energy-coupling factor transporter ATP-binding protein EcfA2